MIKVDVYYYDDHINTLHFQDEREYLLWYPFKLLKENPCLLLVIDRITTSAQDEYKQ